MKIVKRAFGEFHKFDIKMTTSVRFCLLYDPLKCDFIAFKKNIILKGERFVDRDVVNDITPSVIALVVMQFFSDTTLSTA